MSEDELMGLFDITYNRPRIAREPWELESEPHEVPARLRKLLFITHNVTCPLTDSS
jgi:hypothetical protein